MNSTIESSVAMSMMLSTANQMAQLALEEHDLQILSDRVRDAIFTSIPNELGDNCPTNPTIVARIAMYETLLFYMTNSGYLPSDITPFISTTLDSSLNQVALSIAITLDLIPRFTQTTNIHIQFDNNY